LAFYKRKTNHHQPTKMHNERTNKWRNRYIFSHTSLAYRRYKIDNYRIDLDRNTAEPTTIDFTGCWQTVRATFSAFK